ncbi:CHAT domain-containing protein [Leptothoe spongobia]|uniref:CHAT domain-containing protein n=1 Tax=Leptothoe spongobia TAU-MAC 1115 TaxID=1967444 RepID=A0A947DJX2_9CYAN|nr:CHAT domain-containing protein [Leptothoe spongobia]MBT9317625.1 CHAT domain-containing protein [Leptothoe spongobia TAU-MAC 1115]
MGHLGWNQLNSHVLQIAGWLSVFTLGIAPVWGQVVPTGNTTTTTEGLQIQITGGAQSADGANLFHQFESFNVDPLETITFVAPASVENILGRITTLQPSTIDGGLAVSNNANLWLLNPAGIFFGPQAHLNLQGDFTATTADAIGFDQGWFTDGADYQALVGPPRSFAFVSSPGHLINLGNLQVPTGQNIRLLGGSVVNSGTLSAPEGNITIAAVADSNRVSLSQTGQLLALEIEPWSNEITPSRDTSLNISPIHLPVLLTGQGGDNADTLTIAVDGTVQLAQTVANMTPETGHVTVSGTVNSAGEYGGEILILGERLSLVDASINVDGINQGGQIYIGGSYQGTGPLPNASQTQIDPDTTLSANALQQGDGGQIIVWADRVTHFDGDAQAQGGALGGNGGFIEISGKSKLGFTGQFSLAAPQGEAGTILFDPDNIFITNGGTAADVATESVLFPEISAIDNDAGTLILHEATLESWDGDDNIILQANDHILIDLGGNNELRFQPGKGSITFSADADNDATGFFYMTQVGDVINTSGRDINISGDAVVIHSLDTRSADLNSIGNVRFVTPSIISIEETLNANHISLQGNGINFNGGDNSISGQTLSLATDDPSLDIQLGSSVDMINALDIEEREVLALNDGFANILIGRPDGTGKITLYNSIANGGISPFQDPVHLAGANVLQGPDQLTPWTITSSGQGNLNGLFSNGLSFENINSIVVGNGTNDTLHGSTGNDRIVFSGVDAGTFNDVNFAGIQNFDGADGDDQFIFANGAVINGSIDGGTGSNTLDYSAYITDLMIDLETGNASGTGGFSNIQSVIGGAGSNTIQGTNTHDVVTLTGVGTGTINEVAFQAFETVTPGAGDDRFVVNGGPWTSLDGGLGTDTLDYSNYTTAVTVDLQAETATDIGTINNIETLIGGSASDSLIGTNSNDIVLITGNNAGTFNNLNFSNIENHDGGGGNDTFFFSDGTSVTGVLTGGDGIDRANYNNYTTGITVDLQTNSATGTGGFDTVETFIGGSHNDAFKLSATNLISAINGGAGSDTLQGDHVVSEWNLTAVNTGNGTGVTNFSNIENLIAGNQTDQVNFFAGGARFTGALDGGDGPLTLKGDSIGIGTSITGTNTLTIEPISVDRELNLGGPGLTAALDISTPELTTIDNSFTAITIGHPEGTGKITLSAAVTLSVATTIQSPSGNGSINTQGFHLTASELFLSAAQEIMTADLIAPNGVTLKSGDAINTQAILTHDELNGGHVVIDAGTTITTQQIDTTGAAGAGGNVNLNAPEIVQVESIRAEGSSAGGNVTITTDQFVQITGSFTSLDSSIASISTAATHGTGDISIYHGGNSTTPFEIGDSSLLGSNAVLTTGAFQIPTDSSFLNSYSLGNIALVTQDIISPIVANPSPVISLPLTLPNSPTINFNSPLLTNDSLSLEKLTASMGSDDSNKTLFERLENSYSEQFKSHLNLYERVSISPINLDTAQQTLENVEGLMGVRPGVLYVYFLPPTGKDTAIPDSSGLNPNDELGLLLLTHSGQTVRRKVEGVTRDQVMAIANDFLAQITNSISVSSQYLPPAQQLYDWFITPVEDDLQQQGIQSLALAMDTGLRTLPVAALHSGEEFLVERYSLGVIPSFSLTDFNPQNFLYNQLEDTQLLAMGASQFPSQQLLPAVPEELTVVTKSFDDSEVFLNEGFTLDNLQTQVARNEFGIVHLASHGVFEPGEPSHSYIQLWDQPLRLDQVHTLGLQEADIALMVLSACNTALGDREAEYGFAGLAVNAGVQTSVASLWPISDEGTLGLMTYFYENLQQQPIRANALRQAQLAMLQGELTFADGTLYGLDQTALAHFPELEYHGRWNFEHPFYWSTYTLVGSPW